MATEILNIDLQEELYREFIKAVTDKKGGWREQESFTEAINSAAATALKLFLQDLVEPGISGFRDYVRRKYPELDKDRITMIEDLIAQEKQPKGSEYRGR